MTLHIVEKYIKIIEFCCDAISDEFIANNVKAETHKNFQVSLGEFYITHCPFCGDKIEFVEEKE